MPMLTLGTRGWRLLDDVAFACEVVAVDEHAASVDVRYCDDGRVEQRVDLLEFITSSGSSSVDTRESQQHQHQHQLFLTSRDCFECLIQSDCGAALDVVASFFSRVEWLRGLARVSRRWRQQLMRRSLWRTVRIPRAADTATSTAFATTCRLLERVAVHDDASADDDRVHLLVADVVEELVLSGSAVTDEQVLQLIRRCGSSLTRVALRGCSRVSFLLLYELTRLAKQAQLQRKSPVKQVDVWLCRGIAPAYVRQLRDHGAFERAGLSVRGPGFVTMEVSAETWGWIESEAAASGLRPEAAGGGAHEEELPELTDYAYSLPVRFVPRSCFSALFEEQPRDAQGVAAIAVARELRGVRDHLDLLRLTMIPLVRLDRVLGSPEASGARYSLVGMPATPDDLLELAQQHGDAGAQLQLSSILRQLAPPAPEVLPNQSASDAPNESELSLESRADKVFAMLRQTTTDLAAQVAHLERQVQTMTLAKNQALQEYVDAQLAVDRVAKEADRALLSLATASTVLPPPPPCLPTSSDSFAQRAGDELLPPLPSIEQLQALGAALQRNSFAVLDGFVGAELSASVHAGIERMYSESRRVTRATSNTSTSGDVDAPGPDAAGAFQLGELAGGNTGRNLRYKMQHVRGDFVLWLDEHDAFCPPSVQRVLRQLDRLVLERLAALNAELRASSLLRKKAMATCYPGNGARYTRHCDNPNKNGRKLTAIVYLNANWRPAHGGELQLLVARDPTSSSQQPDENSDDAATRVAPLLDRLLLFFSDRRVPHEVLPCLARDRFALTVWYLDYDEFMNAQVFGPVLQDQHDEQRRIQQEIEGFAASSAARAATTEL